MIPEDFPFGTEKVSAVALAGKTGREAVVAELLPFLHRLVRQHYRIPLQDSEDVIHDAIVDFLMQARRCEDVVPGLLVVIARRRCADYWRRQYSNPPGIPLERIPEDDSRHPVARGDEYADGLLDGISLAQAWSGITERCRQFLARRFWKFERARDIAASSGDRPEAVKRFMSRCLAKLRILMEEA